MLREDRERLAQLAEVAAVHRLREAIRQVAQLDEDAQRSATEATGEGRAELGFFADGVDTAAARLFIALGGE